MSREDLDFYPNPANPNDDRVDRAPYEDAENKTCAEIRKGIPCAKGCPHGCAMPVGDEPPRDEQPSAECQMLRERLAAFRALLQRALWVIAETDDEELRVEVEASLFTPPLILARAEPHAVSPPVELTRNCVPGQFVTWTNIQGWKFTGALKEWDNATALIEWPRILTALIAINGGSEGILPPVGWGDKKEFPEDLD